MLWQVNAMHCVARLAALEALLPAWKHWRP
jgi:hypothetical protein